MASQLISAFSPITHRFFQGFNATVLAYGQTASGKTFTLGNTLAIAAAEDSSGIMPRLLKVRSETATRSYLLR